MAIKVLAPQVVAKIAAGEVVERPASVVKELVENSFDAGSSQISVEVAGGGVDLIRVADDGCGIATSELGLAFERHATSKIDSFEDMMTTSSLGFRGEALPSIAAVAEVEVSSCATGEPMGANLLLKEGAVAARRSQGRPYGTTVTVRHLFGNLPARLKFLKTRATENGHIAGVVSHYALAFPEVRFSLSIDGRDSLATPGSGHLADSVAAVYGLEVAGEMLALGSRQGWQTGATGAEPQISGLAASPRIGRSDRSHISFFVNRRWVNSRLLAWAVEEAYHGLLMTGRHPLAVVNISLPPDEVDVNIHPTKSEVKFRSERGVFTAVQRAVRQALVQQAPVPGIEELTVAYQETAKRGPSGRQGSLSMASPGQAVLQTPAASLPMLRVLGQFLCSYIVAEGPDGLYLVDQHAAHERVLFEQVRQQQAQQKPEVQGLLEPVTLEVTPKQDETLREHWEEPSAFGFSVEPFGSRTYLVRAVPALLNQKDWSGALVAVLGKITGGDKQDFAETIAATIACHGAVRFGQNLGHDEMRELLRQLEKAALPNTCPHGRPTLMCVTREKLEKEFGRA
ncbi:MAG: DNA mismatch repair endonuclease MutL [Dehalococcoidales bacterium]|nr:DNA mismatch repair endonuclease MutL [Dehalococcoidales bacterium]